MNVTYFFMFFLLDLVKYFVLVIVGCQKLKRNSNQTLQNGNLSLVGQRTPIFIIVFIKYQIYSKITIFSNCFYTFAFIVFWELYWILKCVKILQLFTKNWEKRAIIQSKISKLPNLEIFENQIFTFLFVVASVFKVEQCTVTQFLAKLIGFKMRSSNRKLLQICRSHRLKTQSGSFCTSLYLLLVY